MLPPKRRKKRGSSKKLDAPRSISFKETLVSWKNGLPREWRIGSKTWLTRRKENRANLSLNTNKLKNSTK